jgi:calcineurin-like phosphoesterase family protein
MSKKFAISDLHFDHKRIIELCNRPFASVEEMNEQMVARWNSVVGANDDVFFGGDFGFNDKKVSGWFEKLNGVKHLVVGNHDHNATKKLGWYSVHTRMEVEHDGTLFVLDHYPIEDWNKRYHDSVHLYGHVHTVPVMELRRRFSMCAEHLNYTPRDLDVFVKMAQAQP